MKKTVFLAFVFAVSSAALAAPGPDATALLKKAYGNYRAQSSEATIAMTIHRSDWERRMQMKTWTRGDDDGLVRFTAPAKDAGNATLKTHSDTWVYNPKLNQVIKLPPSMMAQSWMGSDFSYNDLSKSEDILNFYNHRVTATEKAADHTAWTIECVPKAGAPVIWGKVVLKLRDDDVIVEETFFDQDMKPARRMTADKVGQLGGRAYPLIMTMHPLDTPGEWTRIETLDGRFNLAEPDYRFTISNLQNPRD